MKVNITVTGSAPFSIEVEKEMKVGEFKDLLVKDERFPKGLAFESIKIIYFGKFLDDQDKSLEDYKINDNGRVIVYIQKKSSVSPTQTSTTPTQSAPTAPTTAVGGTTGTPKGPTAPANPEIMTTSQQPPTKYTPPANSTGPAPSISGPTNSQTFPPSAVSRPAVQATSPTAPAAPAAATLGVDQGKLQQMLIMGFDEADCKRALAASRGNVEVAVDYILSGNIPEPAPVYRSQIPGQPSLTPGNVEVQQLLLYLQQNDPETYQQVRTNPALLGELLAQAGISGPRGPPPPPAGGPGALGGGLGGHPVAGASGAGAGITSLATVLSAQETDQVRQISEMTGLDADRCKVVFVRLGRNPDAACDIIFESADRLRTLTPNEIDIMFLQMQQRAALARGGAGGGHEPDVGGSGGYGYDSDDDGTSTDDSADGADDDFYL